jgi:hypothetical protein
MKQGVCMKQRPELPLRSSHGLAARAILAVLCLIPRSALHQYNLVINTSWLPLPQRCPECGGMFPWISWRMFLAANATPGNGGPLMQVWVRAAGGPGL